MNADERRELSIEEEQRYETAHYILEQLERLGVRFRTVGGKVRYRPASLVNEAAKAELKRYKDEIYELLRDEEEVDALHAAQPEVDPLPDDEWEEFAELTDEQQMALCGWISETLEVDPQMSPSSRRDSYELKHIFERSPGGFYTTDEQFRAAMWLSGHLGRRYPGRFYEDVGTRYYYVRPNREGFVHKLVQHAGMPEGWARSAIMGDVERRPPGKEL